MENQALWVDVPGEEPRVGPAPLPEPRKDELLVKVKAVAVQPADWKIQAGVMTIPLNYPAILGSAVSGVVEGVGLRVTHFKPGDRVATLSLALLRNDNRMGGYQRFSIALQSLTFKVGNTGFETAAALSASLTPATVLFLHLGLERPGRNLLNDSRGIVLIWGISSSVGAIAAQLAIQAGYAVVGVASSRHKKLAESLDITYFVDRESPTVTDELVALGPFRAVLSAADSPEDRTKLANVLAAQGGGEIIAIAGSYPGLTFPEGVKAVSGPFVADLVDQKNKEFTEWLCWDYLEKVVSDNKLRSLPLDVMGGLSQVKRAWDQLREGKVSGKRLIITP